MMNFNFLSDCPMAPRRSPRHFINRLGWSLLLLVVFPVLTEARPARGADNPIEEEYLRLCDQWTSTRSEKTKLLKVLDDFRSFAQRNEDTPYYARAYYNMGQIAFFNMGKVVRDNPATYEDAMEYFSECLCACLKYQSDGIDPDSIMALEYGGLSCSRLAVIEFYRRNMRECLFYLDVLHTRFTDHGDYFRALREMRDHCMMDFHGDMMPLLRMAADKTLERYCGRSKRMIYQDVLEVYILLAEYGAATIPECETLFDRFQKLPKDPESERYEKFYRKRLDAMEAPGVQIRRDRRSHFPNGFQEGLPSAPVRRLSPERTPLH